MSVIKLHSGPDYQARKIDIIRKINLMLQDGYRFHFIEQQLRDMRRRLFDNQNAPQNELLLRAATSLCEYAMWVDPDRKNIIERISKKASE